MISAIESITIGVRDIEDALAFYRGRLGWRVECDVRASVSLLAAWKLPVHADIRLVTLSCDGHAFGRLRLAAFPENSEATTRHHNDVGPRALDIYTGAPIAKAIAILTAAGCTPHGEPQRFRVGPHDTEELLLTGPDGLPLLLMVGHRPVPGARRFEPRPGGFSEVATVSVVAGDLDGSRRFYQEGLGYVHETTDVELRGADGEAVCRLMGVPARTRVHCALYRQQQQPSGKVALFHFYDRTTGSLRQPMRPGRLGMTLFTCRCPDLDAFAGRLGRAGGKVETTIQHVAIDNGVPCRLMLVRGPNGELFEFVER